MYKVVQVGKKFIIRRADRTLESPSPTAQKSPGVLRVDQSFWTGTGWSANRSDAKEFDRLIDAAVCHPPE
jgi:hypothetical protein